jgi:hypothetical protein
MHEDYYKILGLEQGASLLEIKKAYKQKAKKLHPDINQSKEAASQFRALHIAYQTLSNPTRTQAYFEERSYGRHYANNFANNFNHSNTQFDYDLWDKIKKEKKAQQDRAEAERWYHKKIKITQSPFYIIYKLIFLGKITSLFIFSIILAIIGFALILKIHFLMIFIFLPLFSLALFGIVWSIREYTKNHRLYQK